MAKKLADQLRDKARSESKWPGNLSDLLNRAADELDRRAITIKGLRSATTRLMKDDK